MPAPLTLVYPYYTQRETLLHHLETWSKYPVELRRQLEFVVVDDGSPEPFEVPRTYPICLRIYRVPINIPWNYGAKNLGVSQARTEWVLLSELDHLIETPAAQRILQLQPEPRSYYGFRRHNPVHGANPRWSDRPHVATYLFHRDDFWGVGGLDEDFAGAYGHDDTFLIECFRRAGYQRRIPPRIVFKNLSDSVLGDCDLRQDQSLSRDTTRNDGILREKLRTGVVSPQKLRFPWTLVYECRLPRELQ